MMVIGEVVLAFVLKSKIGLFYHSLLYCVYSKNLWASHSKNVRHNDHHEVFSLTIQWLSSSCQRPITYYWIDPHQPGAGRGRWGSLWCSG